MTFCFRIYRMWNFLNVFPIIPEFKRESKSELLIFISQYMFPCKLNRSSLKIPAS